ncbi:hypothetical protein ACG04Q_01185 [Roseateles sp. DXS20W]|uniref:Uncharacterized protein n=1 Tax=Pelomonas lactea TaxID=3299030 RepID=A0ABW7GE05_9BURK
MATFDQTCGAVVAKRFSALARQCNQGGAPGMGGAGGTETNAT